MRNFSIMAGHHDRDARYNLGHVGVQCQVEQNVYRVQSYLLSAANDGHQRAPQS